MYVGLFFFFMVHFCLFQAALEDALDSTTLGDLWFEHGELKEARYEHLRALRIRTAKLPAGHRDVAESLESLGNVAIREVRCSYGLFVCYWLLLVFG